MHLLPARMENDSYVRPLDLSRVLKSAGMIVVGPAMTVRDAEKLARDNEQMLLCWMFGSKSRIPSRLLAIFGKRHPLSSVRPVTPRGIGPGAFHALQATIGMRAHSMVMSASTIRVTRFRSGFGIALAPVQ